MLLDPSNFGSRRDLPERPRLSAQGEKIMLWLVCINLVLMFLAPIGGGTIIGCIISLFR